MTGGGGIEKTGLTAETTTGGVGALGIICLTNPSTLSIAGLAAASASSGGMQETCTLSSSPTLSSDAVRFKDPEEEKEDSRLSPPSPSFLSIAMLLPRDSKEGLLEKRFKLAVLTNTDGLGMTERMF